jgi:hypothetical protein
MHSKRDKLYIFERYPELAIKIRNHFGILGHQEVSI